MSSYFAVITPRQDVKTVKTSLESSSLLHQSIKITKWPLSENQGINGECFAIPTVIQANGRDVKNTPSSRDVEATDRILEACERSLSRDTIRKLTFVTVEPSNGANAEQHGDNLLQKAVAVSIRRLNSYSPCLRLPDVKDLLSTLPRAYSVYPPLLLLPHNAFESRVWKDFFTLLHGLDDTAAEKFFSYLAVEMHITHIAVNAPIPAQIPSSATHADETMQENTIRSPTNLKTLYGDFGNIVPAFPKYSPTNLDFSQALWVTTRQNGVVQIWSPMYTMFSSGNITEKARIQKLDSVADAVRKGNEAGKGSTAVDLFAGIGYFAFSYAKSGVSKILCWDVNPWSVEGLRRGAAANEWAVCVFEGASTYENRVKSACRGSDKFLVFSESNANALARIKDMRESLPPIRHVNCGMLPSASLVWKTAVEAIDPELGGWVHLHETAFENNVEERAGSVTEDVQKHLDFARAAACNAKVVLEHIEKVKSIGPRLIHFVLDIRIPPKTDAALAPG